MLAPVRNLQRSPGLWLPRQRPQWSGGADDLEPAVGFLPYPIFATHWKGGNLQHFWSSAAIAVPTITGTMQLAANAGGPAVRFNGPGSAYLQYGMPSGIFAGDLTIVVMWARSGSTPGSGSFGEVIASRNGNLGEFLINFEPGSAYQFGHFNGGTAEVLALGSGNIPAINAVPTKAVYRRKGGTGLAAWQDGTLIASGATGAGPTPTPQNLCIANEAGSEIAQIDVSMISILPVAMPDDVCLMLSLEPWRCFQPVGVKKRSSFFSAGGGGSREAAVTVIN